MKRNAPGGMTGFVVVWIGQFISLLGSGMTTFAISIWAWQETGQATTLALAGFFGFGPMVLLSPVAGAIVDRSNRKLVMMISDLAAGLATIVLLLLYQGDQLEIWHIYVLNALAGAFGAFQFPAYSAAVTMMVPKEQFGRVNGMMALAHSASGIFAPLAAGVFIGFIGVGGVMVIDIVTFIVAIGALLLVHIPQPEETEEGKRSRGSLWQESLFGFKYIFGRPSLLGLQMVFFFANFIGTLSFILVTPMILARTGNNESLLGSVLSIGSVGGVLGGLLLSVWGGPKRKIHGVLLGMVLVSLSQVGVGLGRDFWAWALANGAVALVIPVLNGSNQAIWQAKVAPDVQGRVFAVRRLIAQITAPLAMLLGGPLADRVFEPAMAVGGNLTAGLGWLVGSGTGAGMALMFVITGSLGVLVGFGGYLFPAVRNVETILPDHLAKAVQGRPAVSAHPEERLRKLQDLLALRQAALQRPDSEERRKSLRIISRQMRSLGAESEEGT